MQTKLPQNEIVLLGVGHTNAHVLRMWRMKPMKDARLTCVSNYPVVTYSGMMPGVLAGQYPPERMEIDLVRLCAAAGGRLIVGEVTGLDHQRRMLDFKDRPSLPFDALSIGIGSVPTRAGVDELDDTVLAIKPMQTFLARMEAKLRDVAESRPDGPLRIAIVGAGAGGCEIAMCLPARLKTLLGGREFELTQIDSSDLVIRGVTARTTQLVERTLQARGVRLLLGRRVKRVRSGTIVLDDSSELLADLVLWATSAVAPPLLAELGLPTDERGFLLTDATLKTTADLPIFAVGDSGTIQGAKIPKAGVYAVRQGRFLWENLHRTIDGRPLQPYQPQRGFLKLFNTGDGRAIGEYLGRTLHGVWPWKLKDAIDGKFMDKYQDYRPMEMTAGDDTDAGEMRCAGCGGKVGGSVLSKVLHRLDVPSHENVLLGLDAPDDAAIVSPPSGRPLTVTVDFFAAPLDDAYLSGRLAALNAASDVFALGGQPIAALASATIPVGKPRHQEQLLYELLAGGLEEFRKMGATLVGGHTIEGPQLTIGFTLLADQGTGPPRTKAGLRVGDQLVLTKPLGTGTLLAARMLAQCHAEWMTALLPSMLLSNQPAASLVEEFDIAGLTDVTGFGLAGHLLEMLQASDVACELQLSSIPLLPGASELFGDGIESTLAPANRSAESEIKVAESNRQDARYQVLFDPQTCGGLLLGVQESDVAQVLTRLAEQSDVPATLIGKVVAASNQRRITIV